MSVALLALILAATPLSFPLTSTEGLELQNVTAEVVTYRGRRALRLVEGKAQQDSIAILAGSAFKDGVIEADIAGAPAAGANDAARGFVGIAFRVQDGTKYECFYIRPTNGRAMDQLRRNHSTQYISHPEFPWHRLRKEDPGVYESYADLVVGEWTHVKIVVEGTKAQLYINKAEQPALIVNDLKLGASEGPIALWIGQGTEAHFSRVTVSSTLPRP